MKYVVLFEDNPDADPNIRQQLMPDHLRFLTTHSDKVEAAGPLREIEGGAAGGLWLVEAENELIITELIENDPFWATGLRKSVRILLWTQVFVNGKNSIVG